MLILETKQMSKKGSPWTTEEEADLLEGLRKGLSFEQLARAHERSVKAVAWRWGMYCKKKIDNGRTPEQLVSEFHVSPDFLSKILEDLTTHQHSSSSSIKTPSFGETGSSCDCKEKVQELGEKIDRQTRLLKKIFHQQESLFSSFSKKNKPKKVSS